MRGIYKITNKTTNKIYIGESLDILRRWEEHKNNLNNNNHHSYKLQYDWNLYGQDDFDFEVVSVLDESISTFIDKYICLIFEYIYINKYDTINNGYNIENTLQCVVNKTKSITSDIKTDIGVLKNYCRKYRDKEIIDTGGIIYINSYTFKNIEKELNLKNKTGIFYFEKSIFFSNDNQKILKENDFTKWEIIKNGSYTKTKFTKILYEHMLNELKEIIKIYNTNNIKPKLKTKNTKSKTKNTKTKSSEIKIIENKIDINNLKSIDLDDLDKGFYNLDNSIKNLASKYNLKISYNDLFKLLRNEGILEYRKHNSKKYNYPTSKYRGMFIAIGTNDNSVIRLILTKESTELIIKVMKDNNIIKL